MTNNNNVKAQSLVTVTSLKYLGSVKTDDDSKPDLVSWIQQTITSFTRLSPVWFDPLCFKI